MDHCPERQRFTKIQFGVLELVLPAFLCVLDDVVEVVYHRVGIAPDLFSE